MEEVLFEVPEGSWYRSHGRKEEETAVGFLSKRIGRVSRTGISKANKSWTCAAVCRCVERVCAIVASQAAGLILISTPLHSMGEEV